MLATVPDASVDRIASNYVVMDVPDLEGCARAFARALRPRGRAVVVIGHPCCDVEGGPEHREDGAVVYTWTRSYFERARVEDRWGPFATPLVFHHRPLVDHWRAFRDAGLRVVDLDEPVVSATRPPDLDEARRARLRRAPGSLALALERG